MNINLRLLILTLCSLMLAFCNRVPPANFYEVDGILSGHMDESVKAPNWNPVHYINSRGLSPDIAQPDSSSAITFSASVSNIGNYSFWILATSTGNHGTSDTLDISVNNEEQFLTAQFSVEVPAKNQLQWIRAEESAENNLLPFEESGVYSFSIYPRSGEGVQVHKIHLSRQNRVKPFGLGYPSSVSTDLSASDLFREQPVMLPPAWVFEPLVGLNNTATLPGYLSENNIGGIWMDLAGDEFRNTDFSQAFADSNVKIGFTLGQGDICNGSTEDVFELGFQFIITTGTPELQCLQDYHRTYQRYSGEDQRSVIFHGIKNGYDSRSKLYPAPATPLYQFRWSAERSIQNGILIPGGYRQLIEDLSNPVNSLYNMPFLSFPIDYSSALNSDSDWDSELFIRTVQLSAFLPVMQIIEPVQVAGGNRFFDQLGESDRQQLATAFDLRSALFPYHYSHAHYTRQRNESIIKGFREQPGQFMYGDAFLVAPVLEKGRDGRIIFFPEGRRWFNYHTGENYEAGQSWFVETSSDQIPLFVKAGSVIPYRVDGNQDHLKVEVYTGDAGSFRMIEDDGNTKAYRRAEAARTMFRYNEVQGRQQLTIGAIQSGFEGMTNERSYNLHFKYTELPESVRINNEETESASDEGLDRSWRYDETEQDLIIFLRDQPKNEKLDIVID